MKYFDLHCDTAFECYKKNEKFYENNLAVSGKKGEVFESWHQIFAFWINDETENPFLVYKKIKENFLKYAETFPNNLTPYFSVEGGAVLEKDIDRLNILSRDNIKILTLTWNGENNIAGGINSDKGLTEFGEKVIKRMNELNMVCDLSHLNKKSFYSVAERAERIIATHSNCYKICSNKRNLDDSQIGLIAQKGGIMGICFYPEFLGENIFEKIYENISYLCEKGFEDIVAIGSDFDGGKMNRKLDSISKITDLYNFLEHKNLSKKLISKIFYENAYNFIAKN